MSHTAAPWKWRLEEDTIPEGTPTWFLENLDGQQVVIHFGDMNENDGALVAASPDLLAACKDCLENRGDWMKRMTAAVAKAEGR